MITTSRISVALSGRPVLNDVSLEARAGELTAICGPNGSGKTTTLKAIAGDLKSESGKVAINGADIAALAPWQLAELRGVLPQASNLAFPFTVTEVLRMGLSGRSHRAGEADRQTIAKALKAVDLNGFEGRFYQELSGGEQQRVQLARVLCQIEAPVADGSPRWLLLDEPVASLDILHQLAIMRLAQSFCRAGGGVIAVMHDLNLTALFADRIVLMKDGSVAAAGTPKDVLTDDNLYAVFGARLVVNQAPTDGTTFVLPHSAL
ncbi:heme ABC transporter ATP-binding protein [Martelella lutilitoris]|uniref:Heme ABC transporter ATP-binding protein n=1 Tax=Martelella lutilitoris TaxID=2583532 RepID=A0A7T7HNS2_9HYPH|nr:heme ABC transporter ATP-binding protein [Martelella lutilitoris]QQM32580.1 heme ABC transporter ATP-binding protein [Martelella lutilitoris]